jgi:hypothetical protein
MTGAVAVAQTIKAQSRGGGYPLVLTIVTITGLFADLVCAMRLRAPILDVINRSLADTGL